MSMFMGLVDGDGYIEIGTQKQYQKVTKILTRSTIRARLVIRLHNKDKELLEFISNVLKAGSISKLDTINQTRLIFSKKDLVNIIIPLIKLYKLQFLTYNRIQQYNILNYIIDYNIMHWDLVNYPYVIKDVNLILCKDIVNLDFFADWLIGFTIAEGSFGIKKDGSAFFQIKQKGLENYEIIKAICLIITDRDMRPVKPDTSDCYQLSLSSKLDVNNVLRFFSSSNHYPLIGFKSIQYNLWITRLKESNRYKNIAFFSSKWYK